MAVADAPGEGFAAAATGDAAVFVAGALAKGFGEETVFGAALGDGLGAPALGEGFGEGA